jgi:hypothetical protein
VVMKSSAFWDITPYSPFEVRWCFGATCRLHPRDWRISLLSTSCWFLAWLTRPVWRQKHMFPQNVGWFSPDFMTLHPRRQNSSLSILSCFCTFISTLKMEAICSSEISVDFPLTIRRYIPENRALHNIVL